MSNFEFLKDEWLSIFDLAKKAEDNVYADPRSACFYARLTLENTVKWLYKNDSYLKLPYDTNLASLIHSNIFRENLDPKIFPKLKTIQKIGNIAAHSPKQINENDSLHVVKELFHFLYWVYRYYSSTKPDRELSFTIDLIPRPEKKQDKYDEIAKLLEEKEKVLLEKEKLLKEAEEKLVHIQAVKEQNKQIPDKYDYSEAETREYFIDVLLKEAGWDLKAPNVLEYEIEGMPNNKEVGFVDYVLWGDNGLPLAVVEAKRTRKDAKIGQQQAKLYADCLEKKFNQRPIIFYSNGYETYLWDDLNYPPRQVQGFYKKDELQLLINRRNTQKNLKFVQINSAISGRPYQHEAIKKVCEEFDHRKRKALVVMATGTGKTRMAISLVDVLMKNNWVKRVLFLADRTALLNQAKNAFKAHLPYSNPIDITEDKEGTASRIVLSTYQTIMNLIDTTKSESKIFGVGHFDLIIIDEAHRSVYKKYKSIFDYFDSLTVGLTATPRNEVDKNTYELFELESGVPTYYYELEQAVAQGYLVPPKSYSVPLKFQREGIKYDELPEEEQEEYEVEFYDDETGLLPKYINSSALNKWLFNQDTVDKALKHVMLNGLKVEGGDKLGKTIIFAANHDHAEFIKDRFDANYPHLKGHFARVIDNYAIYAQSLINDFSIKTKEPTIAISVDMLDTGIDVPEVVNLVFFKVVCSKTKFHQMIGRGTRLCPDLFAPNEHKECFYIFDFCMNFEFFKENPEGIEGKSQQSLSQKLFLKRLELAQQLSDKEEQLQLLSNKLKDLLNEEVKSMDIDNFIVRPCRREVEKYSEREIWDNLTPEDSLELINKVSILPTTKTNEDELAKYFDLLILNAQLSILDHNNGFKQYQKKIKKIASQLEEKRTIPAVKAQLEIIMDIQSDPFWEAITITMLEEVRMKIRDLVQFIDKAERKIVYTTFKDEIGKQIELDTLKYESSTDLQQYKKKVEHFLKEHLDRIAINKLRFNKPLTPLDIEELEKMLFSEIGDKNTFTKIYGEEVQLGKFIRQIVGLDRKAAEEIFAEYLNDKTFNSNQIRFISKLIDYLTQNGTIDIGMLYEPPFTDFNEKGIDGIFVNDRIDQIISLITAINDNAETTYNNIQISRAK